MSEEEQQAQTIMVRSPNLTEDEIQRRWNQVFDILFNAGHQECAQKAVPKEAKPKTLDTTSVTDGLIFELGDDHSTLRRGKTAVLINPSEMRALLDGLKDATARLVTSIK